MHFLLLLMLKKLSARSLASALYSCTQQTPDPLHPHSWVQFRDLLGLIRHSREFKVQGGRKWLTLHDEWLKEHLTTIKNPLLLRSLSQQEAHVTLNQELLEVGELHQPPQLIQEQVEIRYPSKDAIKGNLRVKSMTAFGSTWSSEQVTYQLN